MWRTDGMAHLRMCLNSSWRNVWFQKEKKSMPTQMACLKIRIAIQSQTFGSISILAMSMQRSRPARRRRKERGRQPSRSRSCVSFFSRAKDGWLSGCGNLCRRLVMMILCPRVALWQAEGLLCVICNSCYDHCSVCCRLGIMVNTKTKGSSSHYQGSMPEQQAQSMYLSVSVSWWSDIKLHCHRVCCPACVALVAIA